MSEPAASMAPPYSCNQEHLEDRFGRADLLLKAQTVLWRATLAATKPAEHWGMVLVTETEVSTYLETACRPFDPPPAQIEARQEPLLRRAADIERHIEDRCDRTPATVDLRFRRLAEGFGLGPLELDLLGLCLAIERDGRLRRLVGYLLDDATRRRPSVELLEHILRPTCEDAEAVRRSLTRGALHDHGMVVIDGEEEPLAERPVRLDDRIAAFLVGDDRPDARLADVVELCGRDRLGPRLPPPAVDLTALGRRLADGGVVMLAGPYGSGRRSLASLLAAASTRRLLIADVGAALARAEGWPQIVALAFREARLAGAAIAWTDCERLPSGDEDRRWHPLTAESERFAGPVFLVSERSWEPRGSLHGTPFVHIALSVPTWTERRDLWMETLPPAAELASVDRGLLAEELANAFQLTAGQIHDALCQARGEALKRGPAARLSAEDLLVGCRRQSERLLTGFARRIEPRRGLSFDQLVLPRANRRQLDELRARIRHRSRVHSELGFERRLPLGKGLVTLFSGSSGTGKTLAAELLAGEQGVDLYKVDLSAVVSKYVGETEKNLNRVFIEAERSNALLFFDEADALFGKRGEVKEARDRWANLEINYLLQRIEEYPGVVILTTNLRQNIDEAFLRRIQVLVEFPFPDTASRLAIWRGLFPEEVERPEHAVLQLFAERFELAGGSIKNIVVDAAHRAVAENGSGRPRLTARHLALALSREYQKLGKPITRSEFGAEIYHFYETELV